MSVQGCFFPLITHMPFPSFFVRTKISADRIVTTFSLSFSLVVVILDNIVLRFRELKMVKFNAIVLSALIAPAAAFTVPSTKTSNFGSLNAVAIDNEVVTKNVVRTSGATIDLEGIAFSVSWFVLPGKLNSGASLCDNMNEYS